MSGEKKKSGRGLTMEESKEITEKQLARAEDVASKNWEEVPKVDWRTWIWGTMGPSIPPLKRPLSLPESVFPNPLRDLFLHRDFLIGVDYQGDVHLLPNEQIASIQQQQQQQVASKSRRSEEDTDQRKNQEALEIIKGLDVKSVRCSIVDDGADPTSSPSSGGKANEQVPAIGQGKCWALTKKSGEIWAFDIEGVLSKAKKARQSEVKINPSTSSSSSSRHSLGSWLWPFSWSSFSASVPIQRLKLADNKDGRIGGKFSSISVGHHHLLALSSTGHAFGSPIDEWANRWGQLGVTETVWKNDGKGEEGPNSTNSFYSTKLHKINPLKDIKLGQLVAGARHSLALTSPTFKNDLAGRALSWGNNDNGQLGIGFQGNGPPSKLSSSFGSPSSLDSGVVVVPPPPEGVRAPTEVLWGTPSGSKSRKCDRVEASQGGDGSYWIVKNANVDEKDRLGEWEVWAAGLGQYGAIGNASWMSQPSPSRIKSLSNLAEYSDSLNRITSLPLRHLSAGRSHTVASLGERNPTLSSKDGSNGLKGFIHDALGWGHNASYQLGQSSSNIGASSTSRSNQSTPQNLAPLPTSASSSTSSELASVAAATAGLGLDASLLPQNRMHLGGKRKMSIPGTVGWILGPKHVVVEQRLEAGWGRTASYWRCVE